jgi:aspartate/methionine/tyrosine aminotransferase
MALAYRRRRDLLCGALARAGFRATPPQGAYYVIADYSALSEREDVAFAQELVVKHGVATVPVSSFYAERDPSRRLVRFAFCKTDDVLVEAGRRLEGLRR